MKNTQMNSRNTKKWKRYVWKYINYQTPGIFVTLNGLIVPLSPLKRPLSKGDLDDGKESGIFKSSLNNV